jgi:hypothetical protein
MTAGLAAKTRGAVERNLKWLHSDLSNGLACPPNDVLRQVALVAEKKQRDVQTIGSGQSTFEFSGTLEDTGRPVDVCSRVRIRANREKTPIRRKMYPLFRS